MLFTYMNENAFRMKKLSEALEGPVDKEFLLLAEYFQNEFIIKDENIKDISKDIKTQLQIIRGMKEEKILNPIARNYKRILHNIQYLKKNIALLNAEFDKSIT